MKKYVGMAAGILLLVALTMGWGNALSYLRGGQRLAEEAVREHVPITLELARVEQMLAGLDRVIERHRNELIRDQVDAEVLEADVERREMRLAEDHALLSEVAEMLDEDRQHYDIGGIRYSREEVENDAREKLVQLKCDEQLLDLKVEALNAVTEAISTVEAEVAQAEAKRRELAGSIEVLNARKGSLLARRELASVTSGIGSVGLKQAGISRAVQAVGDLERRLDKEERILQGRIEAAERSVNGIDYRAPAEEDRISDRIRYTLMLGG